MKFLSRRTLMKGSLISAGASLLSSGSFAAPAQQGDQPGGRADDELYNAKGLLAGGQLEIRMTASSLNPDLDLVEVAERMLPFNPESWHAEWQRGGDINLARAERLEKEGFKISANEFYLRAARFYQDAVLYLPESDPRMLPLFNKLLDMYKRAWALVPPPYERLEIAYEGNTLPAYFSKPRGAAGQRFPVVYGFGGADSSVVSGGGGAYTSRGMAYIWVDGPGQGIPLRLKHMYAPPDSERVAKVVIDYLVSRPDVDSNRIGIAGASIGGYTAPRCAWGDKRIKACSGTAGAYSLLENIYDYYPPIRERMRWLMGAKDFDDARKKVAEFTLYGRADQIECPMLIGYRKDDRIMDPQGAYKLYQMATKSKRIMVGDMGHDVGRSRPPEVREAIIPDWFAKQLGTA